MTDRLTDTRESSRLDGPERQKRAVRDGIMKEEEKGWKEEKKKGKGRGGRGGRSDNFPMTVAPRVYTRTPKMAFILMVFWLFLPTATEPGYVIPERTASCTATAKVLSTVNNQMKIDSVYVVSLVPFIEMQLNHACSFSMLRYFASAPLMH